MNKQYIIYSDESHKKGNYFSNFYGGALLEYNKLKKINNALVNKKNELNLYSEVKWSKVTAQYLDKYINLINYFFGYIINNDIKIRIMFRQNAYVSQKLTQTQIDNQYFLLYYQFIKHSFGLDYCNIDFEKNSISLKLYFDQLPDTKEKCNEFKKHIYSLNSILNLNNISIAKEDIAEIDSKDHIILQCMDIILGAMNFKLNNMNKVKLENSNKRGKTTIAKEKLYNVILENIRKIHPNFNIGVSTGDHGDVRNRWLDAYRHWNFISKNSEFDKTLTKKNKNSVISTKYFTNNGKTSI